MVLVYFLLLLACTHADSVISFIGYAKVNSQFNDTYTITMGLAFQVQIVDSGPNEQDWKMNVITVQSNGAKSLIQDTMHLNFATNVLNQPPDTAGRISQDGSVIQITYAGLVDGPPLAGLDRYDPNKTYTAWTTTKRGPMQVESNWYLNSIPNVAFAGFAVGASLVPTKGGIHNTILNILQKEHGKIF